MQLDLFWHYKEHVWKMKTPETNVYRKQTEHVVIQKKWELPLDTDAKNLHNY